MTSFIFHYDLEHADLCLRAAPRLKELHEQYEVPGTFFMLGRVLEQKGDELRGIFGDSPLFDIQSHTYAHRMLKNNEMHGPGISLEDLHEEISLGKQWVEDVFERECIGIRSGCGFYKGLMGEPERLKIIADCGVSYLSSDLRGPADSIPSGLQQAFWYAEDGQPNLLEMPGHGWHDNVLKNPMGRSWLALPWPHYTPWGIPNRCPQTPEEEFSVQRVWVEHAVRAGLDYVSPVYHPHSIYTMSPECRTTELLMQYLKAEGIPITTYTDLYRRYAAAPDTVPGRDAWQPETAAAQLSVGP